MQSDASDVGLGAVLLQEVEGQERVKEFASRVLTPAERNYSVTERECLAVVWAIQKFRPYIEAYEFKVVTDHSSLRWLCQIRNPTSRLARWASELQGHHFTVEHRKGALNHVADALSRLYEDEEGPEVAAMSWSVDTEDTWYREWSAKVREQPNDYPTYKLVAGNLYRYRPNPDIDTTLGNDEDAWKLVVPEEHRSEVLRECHDDATAGHLGREKIFARSSFALLLAALLRGNTGVHAIQGRTTSPSRPHGTTRRRETMAGRSWGHYWTIAPHLERLRVHSCTTRPIYQVGRGQPCT